MKRTLYIILLNLALPLFGQKIPVELRWIEEDSIPRFYGAHSKDDAGSMPFFSLVQDWTDEDLLPLVRITDIRSENYSGPVPDHFPPEYLAQEPWLEYSVVYERKRPRLQLLLSPFIKDPEDGSIRRINSFALEISSEKPIAALKSLRKGVFTTSSVLQSGDWFRIAVSESGIHKLTYENLVEIGLQNPASVSIFGSGAVLLPEDYTQGAYDDLAQIPIFMEKGPDQLFGPGDYILFYARGPVSWKYDGEENLFRHVLHPYSTRGFYFISDDHGGHRTISDVQLSSSAANQVVASYDILRYHEEEKYNVLSSGRVWYGDKYSLNLTGTYPFTLENIISNEVLKIRVTAAARSNEDSEINVRAGNSSMGNIAYSSVNLSSYTSTFAYEESELFETMPTGEVLTVVVEYLQPNTNSEAYLNHIILNGRARLEMKTDQLIFRDMRSVGPGNISEFQVGNATQEFEIWDISDPDNPARVPYVISGNKAVYKVETSDLREFIAFNTSGTFPVPGISGKGLGRVSNQDLHGTLPPDLLIIYPSLLEEQATRLAEHRRTNDGLNVSMVTQEMIFNEFSSGTPNVSALRNYLKMFYDTYSPGEMVKYLLLFGDGSFDNRDTGSYNPNLIMTYQSENSLSPTSSYVSDDFYGLLDTGEKIYDGLLDIGIGRLPVSTPEEAELVVDKIISYDELSTIGEWRNYICLIGDDEDGNIHMKQANSLANFIESNYPAYNINKIFLDAYPQETTPTGDRYPDVTRAINNQMNRGALIINYTGHGGITGLAHEKILDISSIKAWNNAGKFPLFMTATCEFSRYDEYNINKKSEVTSAGEEVLLNPEGGSIALFTTTRLVYSGENHRLNEKFYEIVFERDGNGDCFRLGDIVAYSKNEVGASFNKRNFTLLGDPSVSLSFPKNEVVTDSINHISTATQQDTVSALDFVTISGHIENRFGELLENFNGSVIPIVYDKSSNLKTLSNDGGNSMEFKSRNSILYKGNASVTNGRFTFSFYVPKDISYSIGEGKISYYCFSEDQDGHGSYNNLTIGGISDFSGTDTTGPVISIFMNDTLFKHGGIVNSSPELLVFINDTYGVNTTGNGIGHDITAMLNDDRINAVILNEYYQADRDSYSSGSVRYPYSELTEGKHTVTVKVWDILNNSASKSLDFVVVESREMLIEKVFTYPNPFIDRTYFNIEHNRPDRDLEVFIRIYDLQGNLVTVLHEIKYSGGYRLDPVEWPGQSMGGADLGGGLYLYRVSVRTDEGEEAAGAGRLIINR